MRKLCSTLLIGLLTTQSAIMLLQSPVVLARTDETDTPITDPETPGTSEPTEPVTPPEDPVPTDPDPSDPDPDPIDPDPSDPDPTDPDPDPGSSDDTPDTPTEPEQPVQPQPRPQPQPQPPIWGPEDIYQPDPESEEAIEVTPVEEGEQPIVLTPNEMNLQAILMGSSSDVTVQEAIDEYITMLSEYGYEDHTLAVSPGALFDDIYNGYDGIGTLQENTTDQGIRVLEVQYPTSEDSEEGVVTRWYFDEESYLIGSGITIPHAEETGGLNAAQIARMVDMPVESLFAESFGVNGMFQTMVDGNIYTVWNVPSSNQEGQSEMILTDSQRIRSHESLLEEQLTDRSLEDVLLEKLFVYLTSQYPDAEQWMPSSVYQVVEESRAAINQGPEESTTEEESESETTVGLSPEALRQRFAPTVEYDQNREVSAVTIDEGYKQVFQRIESGEDNLSSEDILSLMNAEPTIEYQEEELSYMIYVAPGDDHFKVLSYALDAESGRVQNIRLERRGVRLDEPFSLNVNALQALARGNSVSRMKDMLGQPTVVLHNLAESQQVHYIWSSRADLEIANIEVVHNLADGSYELYYYAPQTEDADTTQDQPEEDTTEESENVVIE